MKLAARQQLIRLATLAAAVGAVLVLSGCTVIRSTGQSLVRISDVGDRIVDRLLR